MPCERGHDQPDGPGAEPDRPGGGDQHAIGGGDRLAAPEAEPDREGVAQHRAGAGPEHGIMATEPDGDQDGGGSLQAVQQQRRRGQRPCCRCAARWSRRCCPSRCGGCRPGRQRGSGSGRTGSTRAGSPASRNTACIMVEHHPNTRRPAFHVPSTTPSSARPSNGVFCALPGSRPASTCQMRSGWNRQRSAGRPLARRPASTPQQRRRPRRQQLDRLRQGQRAVVHLRQRHAEQRGKPGASRRGLGERLALVVGIARLVVGGDRIDRAVGQCGHHRQPVRLLAQRRRQLGVGAEVADRRLVEVEIGRRRVAGHGEAVGLRLADQRAAPRRWRHGRNAPPRRSAPPAGCRGRPGSPRRRPGCRAGRAWWPVRPRWPRRRRRATGPRDAARCVPPKPRA